jgi:hypothetical protein
MASYKLVAVVGIDTDNEAIDEDEINRVMASAIRNWENYRFKVPAFTIHSCEVEGPVSGTTDLDDLTTAVGNAMSQEVTVGSTIHILTNYTVG